jgi:hypothetical protein
MLDLRFVLAAAVFPTAPATAFAQTESTAPPATKSAEVASADKANEMICRKQSETGSLVKVKKTCHTRSQWEYIQQENKRIGQEFVQNNQGRPSGN